MLPGYSADCVLGGSLVNTEFSRNGADWLSIRVLLSNLAHFLIGKFRERASFSRCSRMVGSPLGYHVPLVVEIAASKKMDRAKTKPIVTMVTGMQIAKRGLSKLQYEGHSIYSFANAVRKNHSVSTVYLAERPFEASVFTPMPGIVVPQGQDSHSEVFKFSNLGLRHLAPSLGVSCLALVLFAQHGAFSILSSSLF